MTRILTAAPIPPMDGPGTAAQAPVEQATGAQHFAGLLARAGDEPGTASRPLSLPIPEADHGSLPAAAAVPPAALEPSMPLVLAQNLLLRIELPPGISQSAGPEPRPVLNPAEELPPALDLAPGRSESSGAVVPQDTVPARIQPMGVPLAGIRVPVEAPATPAPAGGRAAQVEIQQGKAMLGNAAQASVPATDAPAAVEAEGQLPAGTPAPGVAAPNPVPGNHLYQAPGGRTEMKTAPNASALVVSTDQVAPELASQPAPLKPEAIVVDGPKPPGASAAGAVTQLPQAPPEAPPSAVALTPAATMQGTAAPTPTPGLPPLEEDSAARPAPVHPPLLKQLAAPLATVINAASGQRTMNIHVAPESLGPITVSAQLGPAGLRVDVSAPTDAGTQALRALLPELRRELAVLGQGTVQVLSVPHDATAAGNAGSGAGQAFAGSGQGQFQQPHFDNASTQRQPSPENPHIAGNGSVLPPGEPSLQEEPVAPVQSVARLDLLA